MARRLFLFEHLDEAIQQYEEMRKRQYPFVGSHGQLAMCYGLKGQFDRGYQVLEEYLQQHPDSSWGFGFRGMLLTDWGKMDEALESFRTAESLDPGNLNIYVLRHPLFVQLEDWEGAEKDARWLTSSGDPSWESRDLLLLVRVRLHQGKFQEAFEFLEQAETASEDSAHIADACEFGAHTLLAKKNPTGALEKALRAQKEGKNDLPEWQGLFYGALAQAKLGRWDDTAKSAETLRTKAEALPTEIEKRRYRHLMGELALVRGDTTKAIQELREAEATLLPRWHDATSQHVQIWYSLAQATLESGDEEEAAEWFQRVTGNGIEHVWWPIEYVRSFFSSLPVGPDNLWRRVGPLVGARREETEAAGELWPDPFACQGLPWIPECRELGLSVLVGAGVELPFV